MLTVNETKDSAYDYTNYMVGEIVHRIFVRNTEIPDQVFRRVTDLKNVSFPVFCDMSCNSIMPIYFSIPHSTAWLDEFIGVGHNTIIPTP